MRHQQALSQWDTELLEILKITSALLPKLVEPEG